MMVSLLEVLARCWLLEGRSAERLLQLAELVQRQLVNVDIAVG